MDNNLPNDPPVPQSPPPMPPNPSFPTNPPNPTPSSHYHQVQSELASHRHRDAHGHFVSEHPNPQPDPAPQTSPTTPSNIPNPSDLPELYSSISWETTQTKVLTFTSGKRRIEQEGVYLESAKLDVFPYDFINYYITQLKGRGFKQTLNKIDPDGITTSFEKTGIFLTFDVKNIFSGSGDSKKITGYKAFIEHN